MLLLANIGTRDVQIDDPALLPAALLHPRDQSLLPRAAGEFLLNDEDGKALWSHLRMPMIEKALRFVRAMREDSLAALRIVLFATDQDEDVAAQYRSGDTVHFAALIKELLFQRYKQDGLTKKGTLIRVTDSNPADYDLMLDFYRAELPIIARRDAAPDAPCHLLIAGGTPQMNTMLLLVGTQVFGPRTVPLYVARDLDRAEKLDVARQLYLQSFQRNLKVVLDAYAYGTARQMLAESRTYLDGDTADLLDATLEYAVKRRNLDPEAASHAFDAVFERSRKQRDAIRSLRQELAAPDEVLKLRETIFLAQIAAATENWADFLTRCHRFSEGCMQLMAEQLGVRWGDAKTRASFQQAWWNEQRTMLAEQGLASAEPPVDPESENEQRQVDRHNLRQIITALATGDEHVALREALAALDIVDRPVPLRNDIVHRFTPISQEEIERRSKASVNEILIAMRRAFRAAFQREVADEAPYAFINRLCMRIAEDDR